MTRSILSPPSLSPQSMRDNDPTDPRVMISPLPSLSPPTVHLPPRRRRPEKATEKAKEMQVNFITGTVRVASAHEKTRRRSNDLFFFFPFLLPRILRSPLRKLNALSGTNFPVNQSRTIAILNHFFDRRSSKHREGLVIPPDFFCIIPALCKKNVHNPCPHPPIMSARIHCKPRIPCSGGRTYSIPSAIKYFYPLAPPTIHSFTVQLNPLFEHMGNTVTQIFASSAALRERALP